MNFQNADTLPPIVKTRRSRTTGACVVFCFRSADPRKIGELPRNNRLGK